MTNAELAEWAQEWRASTLEVLDRQPVQERLGKNSQILAELATASGVLLYDEGTEQQLSVSPKRIYLMPLPPDVNEFAALTFLGNQKKVTIPIGSVRGEEHTLAQHVWNCNFPSVSVILLPIETAPSSQAEKAAVLAHELKHVHQLRRPGGPLRAPRNNRRLVIAEAEAYAIQFDILDVCYDGLLSRVYSEILENGLQYREGEIVLPTDADTEALKTIPAANPAVCCAVLNGLYGYKPDGRKRPPRGLIKQYIQHAVIDT